MPEGVEIALYSDELVKNLHRNGKWLKLAYLANHTNPYKYINIEALNPCLNKPLVDIFYKGKAFFLRFSNDISITIHLMMSGSWSFYNYNLKELRNNSVEDRLKIIEFMNRGKVLHTELEFIFVDEAEEIMVQVYYVNVRFGEVKIMTSEYELAIELNKLAPGFLGKFIITHEEWMYRITNLGKDRMLRRILMEQDTLCSGI